MTIELTMLVWAALLTLFLGTISVVGTISSRGLKYGLSNREPEPLSAWAERAARTHKNNVENIGPFAALILVAHVAGISNDITVIGSQVFLATRVAHAVFYILGITFWRTVVFTIGLVALYLIAFQTIL